MRVDPANQNEHRVKPRGVSPDTVETLEEPWTRHRTGFGVQGVGFGVQGAGFRVQSVRFTEISKMEKWVDCVAVPAPG